MSRSMMLRCVAVRIGSPPSAVFASGDMRRAITYVTRDARPSGSAMYTAQGNSRSTVRRIVEGRARNDNVYPIGFTSSDRSITGSGSMPSIYHR